MTVLKKVLLLLSDPQTVRELVRFRFAEYLAETGWLESVRRREPVDHDGRPLPWMSLPFIDFITPRLHDGLSVFEYGSGNSTLYFEQRAGSVIAVEHDAAWHARIAPRALKKTRVIHCRLDDGESYETAVTRQGMSFDIVIVDGRKRSECLRHAAAGVSERGVSVLDDAERPEYAAAVETLSAAGWKTLPFWGIAPGMHNRKCTLVLYRTGNCLGI